MKAAKESQKLDTEDMEGKEEAQEDSKVEFADVNIYRIFARGDSRRHSCFSFLFVPPLVPPFPPCRIFE